MSTGLALSASLCSLQGFVRLKMQEIRGSPVCFVDFDVPCTAPHSAPWKETRAVPCPAVPFPAVPASVIGRSGYSAHLRAGFGFACFMQSAPNAQESYSRFQGYPLPQAENGGLRIEFARSKMRSGSSMPGAY